MLNAILPQDSDPVNPAHLSPALQETYSLVCALSRRTGACYARACWLAERLGISESQLARRLKQLRAFGLLVIEHTPGLRRLLRPIAQRMQTPPSIERREPKEVQQQAKKPEAETLSDEAESPVVVSLIEKGLPHAVASKMASESAQLCTVAISNLPKNVTNAAGWLRRAVEEKWTFGTPVKASVRPVQVRIAEQREFLPEKATAGTEEGINGARSVRAMLARLGI